MNLTMYLSKYGIAMSCPVECYCACDVSRLNELDSDKQEGLMKNRRLSQSVYLIGYGNSYPNGRILIVGKNIISDLPVRAHVTCSIHDSIVDDLLKAL